MSTTRGHRALFTTATALLLFSLASTTSYARGDEKQGDRGQHKGWYKKDKEKKPVSVPEPGTMVLLITGVVAAVTFARRRPKL